jgi:hypothetical protein
LPEHRRAIDDCFIASEVRLARKHVHRLGSRRARHEFHGENCGPGPSQSVEAVASAVGIDHSGDNGAGLQRFDVFRRWPANAEKNIGSRQCVRPADDFSTRGTISIVRKARSQPRALLDANERTEARKLLDRVRRYRNTRLVGQLTGDSYRNHVLVQSIGRQGGRAGKTKGAVLRLGLPQPEFT